MPTLREIVRHVAPRAVRDEYWRWKERQYLRSLRGAEDQTRSFRSFDKFRCIFVHIPKTGGVSVAQSLFGNKAASHYTIDEYRIIYGKRAVRDYFKFTFVRNPWDRLVSAFTFLKAGGMHETDRQLAAQHLSPYDDFPSFVRGWLRPENLPKVMHFIPQHAFVCGRDGTLDVDFVGRFERMAQDYESLRRKLGFGAPLLHLNATKHKDRHYQEYYTPEIEAIVADVYRRDIELFGYSFADDVNSSPCDVERAPQA